MNLDVCLLLLDIVFYRQKLLNCDNIGAGKGQNFPVLGFGVRPGLYPNFALRQIMLI